jgi:plastocyanin
MKNQRTPPRVPTLITTALALGFVTACSPQTGAATQPSPQPAAVVKVVTDPATIGAYAPGTATISAGQEVEWDFVDLNPHTVSADPGTGAYSSPASAKGRTYRHRYAKAGTYGYHCAIHPEMHGVVKVT